MKYELFYLVANSKESELEAIKAGAQEIVTAEGGIFEEKEVIEKRKLAYEIKHETHGFYVAHRFELEDTLKVQEITRKLNLYTGILRFIISRASELPELKTKEERIEAANNQAGKKPEAKVSAPTPKAAPKKEVAVEKTEQSEESPTETIKAEEIISTDKNKDEDIDKKLEEILNI